MMPVEMRFAANLTWSSMKQQYPTPPAIRSVLNVWGKDFSNYSVSGGGEVLDSACCHFLFLPISCTYVDGVFIMKDPCS